MNDKIKNLRIENPCPFAPTNRNKVGNDYYCKSCKKTIIDFREKSMEEILSQINENTCGIFRNDQLPAQKPLKFSKQILFYFFTVLSFLGFSVKPLSAQTTEPKKDSVLVQETKDETNIQDDTSKFNEKKKKRSKRNLFRRKVKYRTIGCPDF